MTTTNLGRVAIVPKGTYTTGPNKPLDLVRYEGASYLAKTTTSALPTVTSDWDLIASDGAAGSAGPAGATGPQGPAGTNGVDGATLYTWIKYADDASGAGLSDSPTAKTYIGIAVNKTTATESTIAGDYAWSLLGGGNSGGGLLPTAIKTSSYTAAKNELVRCNTTAGAFSISMPASPSDGDIVGVVDIYNTFTANKLTILPNGGTIEGDATSLVLDISGTYVSFVYNSATTNWRLLETPSAAATSGASGVSTGKAIAMAIVFGG